MPTGSNHQKPYPPEFRREAVSSHGRAAGRSASSPAAWVSPQAGFPISLSARLLGVSRSGFHAWRRRPPSQRALSDAWLLERIREIRKRSRESYGARRIHLELREEGIRVGRKRVERLMRAAGLAGYVKRRKGKTTIRVQGVRVASDLVGRDFEPEAPNRLWCADIKEIPTWEGKLYLASVLDCSCRRGGRLVDARRRRHDGADHHSINAFNENPLGQLYDHSSLRPGYRSNVAPCRSVC